MNLTEAYGEQFMVGYTTQFNKLVTRLINALRALHIQRKLVCDELVLKNKKICMQLGIT